MLEAKGLVRHRAADLVGGSLDPALLLVIEAVPHLVADPDDIVVRLVLGQRHDRRDLVMLVHLVDIDPVLGGLDDPGLQ